MYKVTIITPVYNRPEYLEEAVISIQNQTYTNWEHIIIDDGSTNLLTQTVLEKIATYSKVKILRKNNAGLGAARNFGIGHATGEFILTLDDDDKWSNTFIKDAIDAFNNDANVGAVTSWMLEFGDRKREVRPLGGSILNFLVNNNSVHGMFKKSDWMEIGKYDESYFFQPYTDWDFWLRLTAKNKYIEVIPSIHFYYRTHKNGSMLVDSEKNHIDLFRFLIEKNKAIYCNYIADALCLLENKLIIAQREPSAKWLLGRLISKMTPFKR